MAKILDREMDEVIVALAEKDKKRLQDSLEAADDRFEEIEEEALCKAVNKFLMLTTNSLQQQSLASVTMGLSDADVDKLIQ